MVCGYCTSACIQLYTFISSDVNKAVKRVQASAEAGEIDLETLFSAKSLDECSTGTDSGSDCSSIVENGRFIV